MSEWTVEELDGYAVLNRRDGSVPMQFTYISGIKEIADAHNTALAAEREKTFAVSRIAEANAKEIQQLREQLAVAVEALKEIHLIDINENDVHLAAERMGNVAADALAKTGVE